MGRKAWLAHEEYVASDVWKCDKSPSGAHHWKEIQPNPDGSPHTGIFYCKYCYDSRRFPIWWSQVNRFKKV